MSRQQDVCRECGGQITEITKGRWQHEFTPNTPHTAYPKMELPVMGTKKDVDRDLDLLSIRSMLTGDVNRLRYITRHSTSLVLHKENVAEHSYYVMLYSRFICRWVVKNCNIAGGLDVLAVLERGLVHDLDEARTGDFQRPFKYSNPTLKHEIEKAAEAEFKVILDSVFMGDPDFVDQMCAAAKAAKDESIEGRIVAFADYLSVVSYLLGEIGSANYSVMHHYQTILEYSALFQGLQYSFIRPLVEESVEMVHEMIRSAGYEDKIL